MQNSPGQEAGPLSPAYEKGSAPAAWANCVQQGHAAASKKALPANSSLRRVVISGSAGKLADQHAELKGEAQGWQVSENSCTEHKSEAMKPRARVLFLVAAHAPGAASLSNLLASPGGRGRTRGERLHQRTWLKQRRWRAD